MGNIKKKNYEIDLLDFSRVFFWHGHYFKVDVVFYSPWDTTEFESLTSVTADTVAVLLFMVNSEVLAYKGFFLSSIGDVRTIPLKFK